LCPADQYYDPTKLGAKLRDIMAKGDTTELPGLIQELLMQSVTNPFTQAILGPLAQSLAAPLSQYFSNPAYNSPGTGPIINTKEAPDVQNSLDPQLFEIHGFVVIRTVVPENVSEQDIKVLISTTHVTIKGDPSGNEHIIPLPYGAKKEGATAAFRDRVLEIRIPKENEAASADELNVQFL